MSRSLAQRLLLVVCIAALTPTSILAQGVAAPDIGAHSGSGLAPLWQTDQVRTPPARLAAPPAFAPLAVASLPEDAAWEGFTAPGLSSSGFFIGEWHGKLVVGGPAAAGHEPCSGVAIWNGTGFESLPPVHGIQLMTIWNDQIVVAVLGPFPNYQQQPILRFNGVTWDTLGVTDSWPMCLGTFAGDLIVGGQFTAVSGIAANRIAAYDGSVWSAFGAGFTGASDEVDLVGANAGKLIATGRILSGKQIGAWNSTLGTWDVLGQGLIGSIRALTSDGTNLYVSGGSLTSAGSPLSGLMRWDGAAWSAIPGTGGKQSNDATMWNGHLVTTIAQPPIGALSQWDGIALLAIPGDSLGFAPLGGSVSHVGTWGTRLVVTGGFRGNGSVIMPNVAIYDGVQWSTPAIPWDATMLGPRALTGLGAWNGKLVVAPFSSVLAQQDHYQLILGLATFDGSQWAPLSPNFVGGQYKFFETWNGDLIVAGYGITVSGTSIRGVARWDGAAWHDMAGGGMTNTNAVGVFHGDLYIADGPTGVSRWNGSTWGDLGTGLAGPPFSGFQAFTLGVHGDSLIVGGEFISAGGIPASNIAAWDGAAWHALGAGFQGVVDAVGSWNGWIVAGGRFSSSGGVPMVGAAYWDGVGWHQMGSNAMSLSYIENEGGELFASGNFHVPGGDDVVDGVAHWTGSDWHVLGSGGNAAAFEVYNGYLYQSGIGLVNGHASHGLSRVPLSAALDVPRPRPGPHAPTLALTASPNPSRGRTAFAFTLPAAGHARLTVVDVSGRMVATLADGAFAAGEHQARWSAAAPAGVYFARLHAPGGVSRVTRVVRFE